MPERYDVAAVRHLAVGEVLENRGDLDDAGYHYGLVGENAVKHALRASGVEQVWLTARLRRNRTPMGRHVPGMHAALVDFQHDIEKHATGRLGGVLKTAVSDPTFAARLDGWSINIRYADDGCTPVNEADCRRWGG